MWGHAAVRGRHACAHRSWLLGDMMGRWSWRALWERSRQTADRPGDDSAAAGEETEPADWPDPPGGDPWVPAWLHRAAGWSWRLLVLAAIIYLGLRVVSALRLVVLPCV